MLNMKSNPKKSDGTRTYWLSRWTFALSFFIAVGLMIGGFFSPPLGVIDGSVITAVGELLIFPSLLYAFRAIELGYKLKITKGDASVELNNDDEE